jgi:hypothetical protein
MAIKHYPDIVRAHEVKVGMLHELHDSFHDTKLGKELVWLKDKLYDLKMDDDKLFNEFISSINEESALFEEINDYVLPLLKEKEYLTSVAASVLKEDNSCMLFSHFIENLEAYAEFIEDKKLARKLMKKQHLLHTIRYKEELEYFNEIVHNDDCVSEFIAHHGEKGKDALKHLVKSHNETWLDKFKLRDEEVKEVVSVLKKRARELDNAAKWNCERILKKEIRQLQSRIKRIKRQSSRVLDEGARHYKKVNKLHNKLLR